MPEPLLELTEITKAFGPVRALKGVSFDLQAGEVHALLGENGAGKSTLIKVITGAHQPDSGTLRLAGQTLEDLTPARAHRLGIACIYQQPALFPDLTIAENLALRLEPPGAFRRVDWRKRQAEARRCLDRLGVDLPPSLEVAALSMPEQQLVEIAAALGAGARVLILDEPTASLTRQEQERLFQVVRDLRRDGVGLIYISHRLEEIFALADRVTVLRDGQSVGTRPVRGAGETGGELTEAELIRLMVGRELQQLYPPAAGRPGEVLLEARGLGNRASGVHDVTLQLRAGEVVGMAGLVGAGRTELAHLLFGLAPADSGEIRLAGSPVRLESPAQAVAAGIAYVPEDRRRHGVVPEMAIAHNLTLASHRRLFPGGWLRAGVERRLAERQIGELGIKAPGPEAPVATLSGGNQQKVALGRWLATDPRVLILDEPTQGVDVGAKAEIHRIIRRLAAEGRAVLLISSDLPEVLGMSDRILVMRGGRLVAELPGGGQPAAVMEAAVGSGGDRSVRPHAGAGAADRVRVGVGFPWREAGVVLLLALLLGVLGLLAPGFFLPAQLLSLATATAPVLVVAMGLTLVILCRQIDVSVGSQFAVGSVVAGLLAQAGWPMPAVAAGAMASGTLMGLVNGGLIAGLGLPGIVVTLATLVTWRESLRWAREGEFVRDLPETFQWWGLGQAGGQALILSVAAAVFAGMTWVLRGTAFGRHFYAVGSDQEAARLAGLRPRVVTLVAFGAAGALTGLAALLNAIRFTDVDPKTGTGLEMQVIAAAVIGGVAIRGGRGRLWGVLAGVLLLACIAPGLVFLKWPPQWEKAIQGAIILLAVASDGLPKRRPS